MTARAARRVRHPVVILVILALVAGAQLLVIGYSGGRQVAWLMWGTLAGLIAAALALRLVLHRPLTRNDALILGCSATLALWLAAVQLFAEAPSLGFRSTWIWWGALLLLPVARLAVREGFASWLLLVLVVPTGLHGLWLGGIALASPVGHRVLGPDPNLLADRIIIFAAFAMAAYAMTRDPGSVRPVTSPVFLGLLALMLMAALLIHQGLDSRAGMGLLLAAVTLIAVVQGDWRLGLLPVAVLVVFALPWLFQEWANLRQSGAATRVSLAALEDLNSESTRWGLWSAAWSMLPLAGLTGLGFGGFALLYPQIRGPEDGTHGVLVHNDYLQLLVEAGPPMLVALLGFSVLCAWSWGRVARRLRRTESSPAMDRTLVLVHAGLVCVGVVLAHALINFPLFDPALLNITLVAGVVGISTAFSDSPVAAAAGRAPAEEDAVDEAGITAPRSLRMASFGLLALLGIFWLQAAGNALTQVTLTAEHSPFPGVAPPDLSAEQRSRWADRLQALGVGHGMPAFFQANLVAIMRAERGGDLPPEVERYAVDRYEAALAGSPYNEMIYVQYVAFLADTGLASQQERLAILERGLEVRPMGPQLWWALAYHRSAAEQWEAVAEATTRDWFRVCHFAAYDDVQAARGFFDLIPDSVRAAHPDEIARCSAAIDDAARLRERMLELKRQFSLDSNGIG